VPWVLGCAGIVFVVRGDPCARFGVASLFAPDEGLEAGLFLQGLAIVLLGAFALYKAIGMRRRPRPR
jgi:hypothetical protein